MTQSQLLLDRCFIVVSRLKAGCYKLLWMCQWSDSAT